MNKTDAKTFRIQTLGCKVNQCESESLAADLLKRGWKAEAAGGPVTACIVNTCTVTGKAAMQSRQAIRRCRREYPGALIVATGCYATVAPEELQQTGVVDCIVGHRAKYRIPRLLEEAATGWRKLPADVSPPPESAGFMPLVLGGHYQAGQVAPGVFKTRFFLKIQDGCNAFCSYCIVPYARGKSISLPPEKVLAAIRSLAAVGYREIVLSGIHLGSYGLDLPSPTSLSSLLQEIIRERAVDRIRLSSIEPAELTPEIVEQVAASDMVCPHFHIPLQSGADTILQRMGRPYTIAFFAAQVQRIREKIPGAAVGVDVLTGFPGEGEAEFAATCDLVQSLPVSYLHVFPFSPRPGTPAWNYDAQVSPAVIKERCRLLREIGREKNRRFREQNQGVLADVLVETRRDEASGRLRGMTPNYLTVFLSGADGLMSRIVPVRIGKLREKGGVYGELGAGN